MSDKNVKKRNWAFVLYPESAPSDWLDLLTKTGLPCAVSPFHDKDLDPTGSPKKPHYHVIACYSGPTTFNNVKSLTDSLNCPIPIPIDSVKGYYRYLSHKDNPDKFQYDEGDIKYINGFSILDFSDLTVSEILEIKRSLLTFIRDNNICEYAQLIDILDLSGMVTELSIASTNTLFFSKYLSSRRFSCFGTSKDDV